MNLSEARQLIYSIYAEGKIRAALEQFEIEHQPRECAIVVMASNDSITKWVILEFSDIYKVSVSNTGGMYRYEFRRKPICE